MSSSKFQTGSPYLDSPDWITNKKSTVNLKYTEEDIFFQYVITAALNYEEIKRNLERVSDSKPFINKY